MTPAGKTAVAGTAGGMIGLIMWLAELAGASLPPAIAGAIATVIGYILRELKD